MAFHGQEFFEKPGDRNRLIRHFEIRDVMMNRIKQAGVMFAQKPIRALAMEPAVGFEPTTC